MAMNVSGATSVMACIRLAFIFIGGHFPCYLEIRMYHFLRVGFFVPWLLVVAFSSALLRGNTAHPVYYASVTLLEFLVLMMTAVPEGPSVLPGGPCDDARCICWCAF